MDKSLLGMHSSLLKILICLFLIISTCAGYHQVLNNGFVSYDDKVYITDNMHVQSERILDGALWALTSTYAGNWHPVTWLSHILDFQFYGLNPIGHHLTNLLLHIANSLLLFIILNRMTGAIWPGAFAAALFALHPLNVESVAWVAERKNVLSTFFWMLTILFYVYYSESPNLKRYFMVFLAFVLGLMSKPVLVVLPFVLLLLDYWPFRKFRFIHSTDSEISKPYRNRSTGYRRERILYLVLEKVPFFALSAVSCFITYLAQQRGGAISSLELLPLKIRIYNALVAYVSYMGKMFWPDQLAVFYPHPGSIPAWQAAGAALLLLCMSVLVFRLARPFPYLAVGWLWYLGTLLPVTGLVQIGGQSMADRYAYVPMIGLFIIIAWSVSDLQAKRRYLKFVMVILAVVLFYGSIISTRHQVDIWRNSRSLFEHAVSVTPDNYLAFNNLGLVEAGEGNAGKAVAYYIKALKARPNFAEALNNLGNAFAGQGKMDEAIAQYSRALKAQPDFADAHNNLGIALAKQGKFKEAISYYSRAIRINPDMAEAHYNLGVDLTGLGKTDEAIMHFREAQRIKPDYKDAHNNLAVALSKKGMLDEAIEHFYAVLIISPDDANAHYNLAVAFDKKGMGNEAIDHYMEALSIDPDFDMARKSLEFMQFGLQPGRTSP